MKIAVFHGPGYGHFEMLGYIIDYCILRKYDLEVFIQERGILKKEDTVNLRNLDTYIKTGSEWKAIYSDLFHPKQIIWKSIHDFNPNDFTYVILPTSIDPYFPRNCDGKLISINHRETEKIPSIVNIGTRFFNDKDPWALPVFPGVSRFEKQLFILNRRITVVLLGQCHAFTSIETLKKIFINFEDIDFYFIHRDPLIKSNLHNVTYLTDISTDYMINIFKKSHYFFCGEDELYYKDKVSCAFFLAFSYGCRLILPKNCNNLQITTPLYYDTDSRINLTVPDLDPIFSETHKLMSHRNRVFDYFISSWFIKICEKINRFPPKTFVETGTYLGCGIKNVINFFDTIHSIELKYEFVERAREMFESEKHVFIHHGDSAEILDKLSNELLEPVLFYLDSHYSGGETAFGKEEDNGCPLLRELTVLGKRTEPDIIIIDDIRLMGKTSWGGIENDEIYPLTLYNFEHITMETILKAYNKKCTVYFCNDCDRIVLFN